VEILNLVILTVLRMHLVSM